MKEHNYEHDGCTPDWILMHRGCRFGCTTGIPMRVRGEGSGHSGSQWKWWDCRYCAQSRGSDDAGGGDDAAA